MRVLYVLMSKHAMVRLRNFRSTFVEFASPLTFFLLMFFVRHIFLNIGDRMKSKDNLSSTETIPMANIEPRPFWLMYTPESKLTDKLMDDVGAKLKLKRLSSNPDFKERGYFPYPKGTRLADIAAKMNTMQAHLVFNDMSGGTWPARLNYTIRMKGDFQTDGVVLQEDDPPKKPPKIFNFQYGTFMVIQWAIDTSYIKMLSSNEIPQNLSIQALPYVNTFDKVGQQLLCTMLFTICWLSLMLAFVFHMSRLLQERASGIQELMKMVGVSLNSLTLGHYLNILPVGLIFAIGGTIICKTTSMPMVSQTDGFIICLMLFLYFNSVIALAFVCSYVTRGTHNIVTISSLAYSLSFLPTCFLVYMPQMDSNYSLKLLTGLLPYMPNHWFWQVLADLEFAGRGANFSNITERHDMNPPIILSYLFTLLQTLMFYVLAWYLSLVRPGQYGQALPWNFICKSEYWSGRRVAPEEDEENLISLDSRYFEPGPSQAEAGIKVVNVSKVYPKHKALNNVSLEVYKGEITVLVGHNGAGKTTLMSIITGMTSATEGKVYVNGKDTVTQKSEVRKNIGYCPQHNLFFDDLTLQEHIMFFTLLKRGSYSEAKVSASQLAEQLGISDKLNSLTTQLSGGMKRRAQLACALAGGADVLVLDEPTSGLDVETRRELWDLLLSLRGERTVLLTTHFMEEADALGDRVAALHSGLLKCFATPMHLKKAVGTGYRLSLTTVGMPKEEAITKVVTSHIPDATLQEHTNNSLTYNLPAAYSSKFPKLFSDLEAERSKLGIDSIGVGVSTLDEVFMKLCSNIDTPLHDDETDNDRDSEMPPDRLTGIPLYVRQLYVLLKRQVKYATHKKWIFLVVDLISPILIICMVTRITNTTKELKSRSLAMTLEPVLLPSLILYRLEGPHVTAVDILKMNYKWSHKGVFLKSDDVFKTVLEVRETDPDFLLVYLAGVEVETLGFKVLFSTMRKHAAPIGLNILSNMLAVHYIPGADGYSIITMNDPIEREMDAADIKNPKNSQNVNTWGLCLIFIILSTTMNNISLPCKERLAGARHIHIMSGCPVELHWLATLSFHMLCALLFIVATVLAAYYLDNDDTFNQPDLLRALALILFLGCMAFLAFSYLVSLNFGERGAGIFLVVCIVIGVTTGFFKTTIDGIGPEKMTPALHMLYYILVIISYTVTPHVISETVLRCLTVGRINAWCENVRDLCPTLFINDAAFDTEKCCAGVKPRCYFCIDKFSPGLGIIILIVHILILMTLVFMTERGVFNGLIDKVMNSRYKSAQPADQDDMVRAEKAYVSKAITLPTNKIPDAMLVDELHKNYVPLCRKNVNAIKGVSFSVKKGECFGLLGVNGAGKSTCFKMMTAEECITRGKIFGNGYFLRRGNSQYLQTLGYCPQFFGLDMFQTGEENLAMVLTLRGFDKQTVEREVQNWIQIVGLEKYARRPVEGYSGGCVRRLGTASALCGGAQLALLDEPTAGVDVAARRRLWTALRKALRSQRAVIITSHSMDEMEALCSRIAILAGGRVRALGTAAALRSQHAQGHAVVFKVKHAKPGDEVDRAKTQMDKFKGQLQEMFNCTLKDEHKTMLHYHINETMPYSDLFAKLETLREDFPALIEDYSVTETTLEEVFLSFAKEQQASAKQDV